MEDNSNPTGPKEPSVQAITPAAATESPTVPIAESSTASATPSALPETVPVSPPSSLRPLSETSAPSLSPAEHDARVDARIRAISRRSFLWSAVTLATGYAGWRWLNTRRMEDQIIWPFRRVLELNEDLARDYFRAPGTFRLAPTFAREQAQVPKQNGTIGLLGDFEPTDWKLHVIGLADTSQATMMPMAEENPSLPSSSDKRTQEAESSDNSQNTSDSGGDTNAVTQMPVVTFTLDDIKKLPRVEMTTEFKCIEGWSYIVHWAGARLVDFIAKYPPATKSGNPLDLAKHLDDLPDYVSLRTPDAEYYVGLEIESALHPQTLLCYEMNGKPLPVEHGGPLRLVIPVKYNVKNLKRIGTIEYTSKRPADYWAEQGYDWYVGH